MKNPKTIRALFAFPGFTASAKLQGIFGDRYARVIHLKRRKKQLSALVVVTAAGDVTTRRSCGYAICRWLAGASTWSSNAGESVARGVTACM